MVRSKSCGTSLEQSLPRMPPGARSDGGVPDCAAGRRELRWAARRASHATQHMHWLDRRRGPRPLLARRLVERAERRRCARRAMRRAAPRLRRARRAERRCEWPLRDAHVGGSRPVEVRGISEHARRGAHRRDGGEACGDAQGARGGCAGARDHLRLMSSNSSILVDQLDQHPGRDLRRSTPARDVHMSSPELRRRSERACGRNHELLPVGLGSATLLVSASLCRRTVEAPRLADAMACAARGVEDGT